MKALIVIVAASCITAAWAAPPECRTHKTVGVGEFCTVRPSSTDPAITDVGATAHGFGDHVIAFPARPIGKLWVHFGGSGAKPYLPNARRYLNEVWLSELMARGYTVVDLAYDNETSITESCKAAALDDCAGAARLEVLTGQDVSPLRSVTAANSVVHRLQALLRYADDLGFPMPDNAATFRGWGPYLVSGHSQGAGYAYYIAKNYGVTGACFLGGPYDIPDPVPVPRPPSQAIADWYLDSTNNRTPVGRMGAFVTKQDDYYDQFAFAFRVIGVEWVEANKRRYTDGQGTEISGHAAAVGDPSLAYLRAKACF